MGGKIGPVGFTKLLLLWELLVLGEPVLVFSNEPRVGAEAVEHLRRLIRPVRLVLLSLSSPSFFPSRARRG